MPRVTITVPDHTSQPYRFQLDRKVVTIGRGSDNDIAIECASVSTKHAEMARIPGGYEVRDVGSTNGVKFAGKRGEVIRLESDMTVHLGDVAFHFLLNEEELEALRKEKPEGDSKIIREDPLPPLPPSKDVPRERKVPSPQQPLVSHSGGGGEAFGMICLFILLAAVSLFIGLSIRHKRETGGSLIEAIQKNLSGDTPAPATK